MASLLIEIKPILKGWLGHFKYRTALALRDVDGWGRERIRHIMRRRKRRGLVKGRKHV